MRLMQMMVRFGRCYQDKDDEVRELRGGGVIAQSR
jgi:hypothetical protein